MYQKLYNFFVFKFIDDITNETLPPIFATRLLEYPNTFTCKIKNKIDYSIIEQLTTIY